MIQAIVFAITIFVGWIMFDAIKHKKFIQENIWSGLITAVIAGAVWYVLFIVF
ncbi:hypothetical protein SAMN05421736_11492 [Evansella caseinilytica]|uniref:Uncharacterized protein n=1 Tax=Evansella caseinilytica TaxID=1503961 RepID=A0A1H3TGQ1_9BACI|nr:hypothetical protein [Evansella caseinilytica]SDZ49011.1 hypothetical protein SAMN05421736_11492 [Evansella caseinilytica]